MRAFLIVVISLLALSCSSVNTIMQPEWITETPKLTGSVAHVGSGVGESREKAKAEAYQDALVKLGGDLGYDVTSNYYREFISSDAISSLATTVSSEYSYQDSNGIWHYYVMARTPAESLVKSRSADYRLLLQREERISKLLQDALDLYKDNRDVDAINAVLQAIVVSSEGDVNNPEYTPESLLEKAIGYVNNLKLYLKKQSTKTVDVTVQIKRSKGFFYPAVKNAEVLAAYPMTSVSGTVIESTLLNQSDDRGYFRFTRTNPYMVRDGEVKFSIYLDPGTINQIAMRLGNAFISPLLSAIEGKSVYYEYHGIAVYSPDDILFAFALYDVEGHNIKNEGFLVSIQHYLDISNMPEYNIVWTEGDDFEDVAYNLLDNFPGYRYYMVCRVGIVDFKRNLGTTYAKTEGRSVIYDPVNEIEISVLDTFTTGSGVDEEAATDDALSNIAQLIAGRLLEEL